MHQATRKEGLWEGRGQRAAEGMVDYTGGIKTTATPERARSVPGAVLRILHV